MARRSHAHALFAAALLSGVLAFEAGADTVYVDAAASGANSGSSWADAFTSLQSALAAAVPGDEIWVAAGTYTPGPPDDPVSSFVLRPGVALYAGFSGVETARIHRNWVTNATILSGDAGHDDTVNPGGAWPYNVVLNTPNSGHVVVAEGVDATAVLDGFRVEKGAYGPAGLPAGDPMLYASGLYCVAASPTITNCTFSNNLAAFGNAGAVFLLNASPAITGCSFDHNLAYQGSGGAIWVGGASQPTIADCTFTGNLAVATSGQTGQGGAIQLSTTLPVTISRCTFTANSAQPFGSGSFETPRAGAISSFCIQSDPTTTIRECVFRNNQAAYGGAVFVWNPTTILNCTFDHNSTYSFAGQGGQGAGICIQWTSASILNCSIAANTGGESGGVNVFDSPPAFPAQADIRNSVIWGNAVTGQDVSIRNASVNGPFSAENSCIQHLLTVDPGEDPIDPAEYPGCIIVNPQFTNVATGDLHLLAASPCIDTGDNVFVPPGTPADLDAHIRVVRGLPGPGAAIVDMGALEFGAGPCTPSITVNPVDRRACRGGVVTFGVAADGPAPLSYRWRKDALPMDPGDNPSAATPTLVITNPGAPDAGSYDCTVTSACGDATSAAATLTVCPADFNCDGVANSTDVSDFINQWFADQVDGTLVTDWDHNGVVNSTDVSSFINAWFEDAAAGCG